MKLNLQIINIFLLVIIVSLSAEAGTNVSVKSTESTQEVIFNQEKWLEHKGDYYPHRESMIASILHTNLVRSLNKKEIIELLGEPSYYRDNKDFLYYLIDKKTFLGYWTLHTKTLVIKINESSSVDWVKIHE